MPLRTKTQVIFPIFYPYRNVKYVQIVLFLLHGVIVQDEQNENYYTCVHDDVKVYV